MINITYNSEGIRVEVGEISKYNNNNPLRLRIIKHVSGEEQWSTNLNDFWFATFPNTEMFNVQITDSRGVVVYKKIWDVFEHGNHFYKSLWLYNKKVLSNGKLPKGLVIGTHDGEFGEWVPIVLRREANVVLVEASDAQFNKLLNNYKNNSLVKPIKNLITPNGGDVEFFEGGAGYTNTVVEKVIRHWETEEVHSTLKPSISITDLILNECGGSIDWLHLDVEGLDAKLIMGIDESRVKLPDFIIFEDYNLSLEEKEQIHSYLHNRGYKTKSEGGICEAVK
jgi:FkbM family methyltransferase